MSHYDSSSRSLPKYRRQPSLHEFRQDRGYVQDSGSHVPCSPRLVQRKQGQQQRVVTRMLQSYPQSDGSFVCPIRQPTHHSPVPPPDPNEELPPPLPAKRRELLHQMSAQALYPSVTVNVPYRRIQSANDLPLGRGDDRRSMPPRSLSHQHQPAAANDLLYQPKHPLSISRTQSQPNHIGLNVNNQIQSNINVTNHKKLMSGGNINSDITTIPASASSTLIISTQNAIPLHSVVTVEHSAQPLQRNITAPHQNQASTHRQYHAVAASPVVGYNNRAESTPQLQFAKAVSGAPATEELLYAQRRNGAVRRSNSQTSNTSGNSSSTYTGSLDYNSKGYTDKDTRGSRMSESRDSSVEAGAYDEDSDSNHPELYPEQR